MFVSYPISDLLNVKTSNTIDNRNKLDISILLIRNIFLSLNYLFLKFADVPTCFASSIILLYIDIHVQAYVCVCIFYVYIYIYIYILYI